MRKSIAIIAALVAFFFLSGFSLFTEEMDTPEIKKTTAYLDRIKVTLKEAGEADGYTVRVSAVKTFDKDLRTKVVKSGEKDDLSVTVSNLKPGTAYYIKVKAWKETDEGKEFSSYSDVKREKTLTYKKRARQIMDGMSLSEKASQTLFVYVPKKDALRKLKKYQYGGYLLFAYNVDGKSSAKLKKIIKNYQKASKIKMFIGADEEGGDVCRLSSSRKLRKSRFSSPRALYKSGGFKRIKSDTKKKDAFLLKYGVNTNLAPVADVAYSKKNFIYSRSFSTKAKPAAKYIKVVVKQMNSDRVVSCLKHFPGYGNNKDTHTGIAADKRSLSTFKKRDLVPFAEGIKNGAPMIMIGHNRVKAFDGKLPASISKPVHSYLRKKLGFTGVIITDGMDMAGVREYGKNDGALAVKAINAGNDMICTPYGKASVKAIAKAVKSGKIKKERLDKSVERILVLKLKMGIIK